jgi:hypothetical protein
MGRARDQVLVLFFPGHRIVVSWQGHAPAIACRDVSSSPPRLGMAQRIGGVRLHADGWPDGGGARCPGRRAVAGLAAARQWLPGSGHGPPALGRGDGPARCCDPARAGRKACCIAAAHIAPKPVPGGSAPEVWDARLKEGPSQRPEQETHRAFSVCGLLRSVSCEQVGDASASSTLP